MHEIMKITPFFLSPFISRHWSMIALNGHETASSIASNSHHITYAVYGFRDDNLFALITFKDQKDLNGVRNLFGRDVKAAPLPKATRLRDTSEKGIISNNKTFMRNNFENVIEIN